MPFFCLHKHKHAARGRSDSERPLLFKLISLIITYFCIELPLTKAKVNSRVCEAHGFFIKSHILACSVGNCLFLSFLNYLVYLLRIISYGESTLQKKKTKTTVTKKMPDVTIQWKTLSPLLICKEMKIHRL